MRKGYREMAVSVVCTAVYKSYLMVPEELEFDDAIEYATEHLGEIPCGELEWIGDIEIDPESTRNL